MRRNNYRKHLASLDEPGGLQRYRQRDENRLGAQ